MDWRRARRRPLEPSRRVREAATEQAQRRHGPQDGRRARSVPRTRCGRRRRDRELQRPGDAGPGPGLRHAVTGESGNRLHGHARLRQGRPLPGLGGVRPDRRGDVRTDPRPRIRRRRTAQYGDRPDGPHRRGQRGRRHRHRSARARSDAAGRLHRDVPARVRRGLPADRGSSSNSSAAGSSGSATGTRPWRPTACIDAPATMPG